jgi:hypothetical protein
VPKTAGRCGSLRQSLYSSSLLLHTSDASPLATVMTQASFAVVLSVAAVCF